jgi:hypothetical protein
MKNLYEIFDEFELAKSNSDRKLVIQRNLTPTLVKVLEYTFHPQYRWKIKDMPRNYKIPKDTAQGISHGRLPQELRRIYLFQEGHPEAEKVAKIPGKQNELLVILLETLEPREAEVLMGIFRKDLGVAGLTYDFVRECFPNMLPQLAKPATKTKK